MFPLRFTLAVRLATALPGRPPAARAPATGFQLTRVQFDPSNPTGTMRPVVSKLSLPGAGTGTAPDIAAADGPGPSASATASFGDSTGTAGRVQDKNVFAHELKGGARPGREKARAGSRAKGKTGRQVPSPAAATGAIHSRPAGDTKARFFGGFRLLTFVLFFPQKPSSEQVPSGARSGRHRGHRRCTTAPASYTLHPCMPPSRLPAPSMLG